MLGLLPILASILVVGDTTGVSRDTIRYQLDRVVVTATRSPLRMAEAPAATTLLEPEGDGVIPGRTVAEALEATPGLVFLDFDGTGGDPQPVLRGFYGGGESEYLLLLLDGVPTGRLHDGRINWDLIPLAAVERVEILRGGSSPVWGDGALGGVVNLVTRGDIGASTAPSTTHRFSLEGGSLGSWAASGSVRGQTGGRMTSAWGGYQTTNGFRERSSRSSGSAGGAVDLLSASPRQGLTLSALIHRRESETPGPITRDLLEEGASPREGLPFFRFDQGRESRHRVGLDGFLRLGDNGLRLSGHLVGEWNRWTDVRTLPLSPFFADTQEREATSRRVFASGQVESPFRWGGIEGSVMMGADLGRGTLENAYWGVLNGGPDAYLGTGAERPRGDLLSRGEATRSSGALFVQGRLAPHPRLGLHGGVRRDELQDRYEPGGGEGLEARRGAWSPSVGLTVILQGGAVRPGPNPRGGPSTHLFGSLGRSFRAANLDQLFDERATPVPFPPFAIITSNPLLEPQKGVQVEVGMRHARQFLAGGGSQESAVTFSRMDVRDQLDFDLTRFRYVNLGRSRQQGVELSSTLRFPSGHGMEVNYTLQQAEERGGEYEGRQLKAVPRHAVAAGGWWALPWPVGIGGSGGSDGTPAGQERPIVRIQGTRLGGMWLDDANLLPLDSFLRVDLALDVPLGPVHLTARLRNALGARYSSTGYPDPAGTSTVYLYPAAGRTLQVGLTTSGPSRPGPR